MFGHVGELWKGYLATHAPTWERDDPRHGLGAEIRERLEQLDTRLQHLDRALSDVRPDPEETSRQFAWMRANALRPGGEMSIEEYLAGLVFRTPAQYDM